MIRTDVNVNWVSFVCEKYHYLATKYLRNVILHPLFPHFFNDSFVRPFLIQTIQRGFPWARISLFTEQIPCVPCAVFLSEQDALVPSEKVERYLLSKGAVVLDSSGAGRDHFLSFSKASHPINVTIFQNQGHGELKNVMDFHTHRKYLIIVAHDGSILLYIIQATGL